MNRYHIYFAFLFCINSVIPDLCAKKLLQCPDLFSHRDVDEFTINGNQLSVFTPYLNNLGTGQTTESDYQAYQFKFSRAQIVNSDEITQLFQCVYFNVKNLNKAEYLTLSFDISERKFSCDFKEINSVQCLSGKAIDCTAKCVIKEENKTKKHLALEGFINTNTSVNLTVAKERPKKKKKNNKSYKIRKSDERLIQLISNLSLGYRKVNKTTSSQYVSQLNLVQNRTQIGNIIYILENITKEKLKIDSNMYHLLYEKLIKFKVDYTVIKECYNVASKLELPEHTLVPSMIKSASNAGDYNFAKEEYLKNDTNVNINTINAMLRAASYASDYTFINSLFLEKEDDANITSYKIMIKTAENNDDSALLSEMKKKKSMFIDGMRALAATQSTSSENDVSSLLNNIKELIEYLNKEKVSVEISVNLSTVKCNVIVRGLSWPKEIRMTINKKNEISYFPYLPNELKQELEPILEKLFDITFSEKRTTKRKAALTSIKKKHRIQNANAQMREVDHVLITQITALSKGAEAINKVMSEQIVYRIKKAQDEEGLVKILDELNTNQIIIDKFIIKLLYNKLCKLNVHTDVVTRCYEVANDLKLVDFNLANIMIFKAATNGYFEPAKNIFKAQKGNVKTKPFNALLTVAMNTGNLRYAMNAYRNYKKPISSVTVNIMIGNAPDYQFAERVFLDNIDIADETTINIMIKIYSENNNYQSAKDLYKKYKSKFDQYAVNTMIKAAADNDDYKYAMELYNKHQIIADNTYTINTMIKAAADNGQYHDAQNIFKEQKGKADVITVTTMINAASNAGDYDFARSIITPKCFKFNTTSSNSALDVLALNEARAKFRSPLYTKELMPWQSNRILDLHGFSTNSAYLYLEEYIPTIESEAQDNNQFTIIVGKGDHSNYNHTKNDSHKVKKGTELFLKKYKQRFEDKGLFIDRGNEAVIKIRPNNATSSSS